MPVKKQGKRKIALLFSPFFSVFHYAYITLQRYVEIHLIGCPMNGAIVRTVQRVGYGI